MIRTCEEQGIEKLALPLQLSFVSNVIFIISCLSLLERGMVHVHGFADSNRWFSAVHFSSPVSCRTFSDSCARRPSNKSVSDSEVKRDVTFDQERGKRYEKVLSL